MVLLVALSLVIRIVWAFLTDNYFYPLADYKERLFISWELLENPVFIPSLIWPFGHFWMLSFFMWIFNDTEFAPRLVGLISGSLMPLPIFALGKRLFSPLVAVIACLIYGFALPQLILSGLTLTAIPFTFFILAGVYYTVKFLDDHLDHDIYLAGFFLMIANSLRLEGWFYSFIIGLYLVWKIKAVNSKILLYALLTSTPILIVMWDNYINTGDLLHALNKSDRDLFAMGKNDPFELSVLIPTLFAFSGISFPLGIIGAVIALVKRKNVFVVLLFSFAYLFPVYKIFTHTLSPVFRYFTTQAVFSYLLTGYTIVFFADLPKVNRPVTTP